MNANPRIVGAVVVGGAMLAGAYVLSDFGTPPALPNTAAVAVQGAPLRTPIPVTDSDNDGLEDWRNSLAIGDPISLSAVPVGDPDYQRPETLSGNFSLTFFEQLLRSQMYGEFGSSDEAVIQKSIAEATAEANDVLYDLRDIVTIPNEPQLIRAYGNRAANILTEYNVNNSENETLILKKALERDDPSVLLGLEPRSQMYAGMRDAYLNTPVPEKLATAHLNLINSFHALHRDIEGMTGVYEDPLYTLVRLKRYQDDATALAISLSNLYVRLAETPEVFQPNDTALLFLAFAPTAPPNQ